MSRLTDLTLSKRISLIVLVGLVVGLGLFSWLGIRSVNESTERALDERLTIARILAGHIDENLTHVVTHLRNTEITGNGFPDRVPRFLNTILLGQVKLI